MQTVTAWAEGMVSQANKRREGRGAREKPQLGGKTRIVSLPQRFIRKRFPLVSEAEANCRSDRESKTFCFKLQTGLGGFEKVDANKMSSHS